MSRLIAHPIHDAASLVRLVVDIPIPGSQFTAQTPPPTPRLHTVNQHGDEAERSPVKPVSVAEYGPVPHGDHGTEQARLSEVRRQYGRAGHSQDTHRHPASMRPSTGLVLWFATQTDFQAINGGPAGELAPERVAVYIAKYATTSADDLSVGGRRISLDALPLLGVSPHVARIVGRLPTQGRQLGRLGVKTPQRVGGALVSSHPNRRPGMAALRPGVHQARRPALLSNPAVTATGQNGNCLVELRGLEPLTPTLPEARHPP